MAFNPIHAFRKYQKFWMAAILLMCMITFVLCTGVGGDLGERITQSISSGRRGKKVGELKGSDVYSSEMHELRQQRKVATEFMRRFCEELVANAEKVLNSQDKEKKGDEKAKREKIELAQAIRDEFRRRLDRKPLYFGGGLKLEDLFDFKMWLKEADQLQIRLDPELVQSMLALDLIRSSTGYQEREYITVLRDVRHNNQMATEKFIIAAVGQEFRVRLAQLAMITSQPTKYFRDFGRQNMKMPTDLKVHGVRAPLAPAQLWSFFKEKRAEFNLVFVPVEVEDFLTKVQTPDSRDLEKFFSDYASKPSNPTSPEPGFQIPAKVKVQWITADPDSPDFKNPAKLEALFELAPLPQYCPMGGALENAVRYAVSPYAEKMAYQSDFEKDLHPNFFTRKNEYDSVPLTSGGYVDSVAASQGMESPLAVSAFLGALARPDAAFAAVEAWQSVSYDQHGKELDFLGKVEAARRLPIYATATALAGQFPLNVAAAWYEVSRDPQTVPIDILIPKYRERYEKSLALAAAQKKMLALRTELENPRVQGQANAVMAVLAESYRKLPVETKEFHDRYTIRYAKELAPLRKSYDATYYFVNVIDGRLAGTKKHLTEDDFYKLFFDKDESFSAAAGPYNVRPWPPVLTAKPTHTPINGPEILKDVRDPSWESLKSIGETVNKATETNRAIPLDGFKFGKRQLFLFWISETSKAETPTNLAEVRGRVEKAWKVDQARDKFAMTAAEKIAAALQDRTKAPDIDALTQAEAKKLGHERILLRRFAPLYLVSAGEQIGAQPGGPQFYSSYRLPKDAVVYPRPDMVQQLLTFAQPTGPVKSKLESSEKNLEQKPFEALDKLNKELFDQYKAGEKDKTGTRLVQILTNEPRTIFYVAVALTKPEATVPEFITSYQNPVHDTFLQECFDYYASSSYTVLLEQTRQRMGWKVTADADDRKGFDTDGG